MSSFLCSNRHTVVIALLAHAPGIVGYSRVMETARIFRSLNNASIKGLYMDKPQYLKTRDSAAAILSAADWIKSASAADISKAVQCFAYQCDEAPANHRGRAVLASVQNRVYAMPGAGGPSGIWSI